MAIAERPTMLVAKREILDGVRTLSFKLTLALSAVAIVAIMVIANATGGDESSEQVVVAGPDAEARAEAITALGPSIGITIEATTVPDDEAAVAAVDEGDADVAVSSDGTRLTTAEPVDLEGDSDRARLLNVLRADLALENGLRAAGLSPEQADEVRATPPPDVEAIDEGADEVDGGRVATVTVTNILLFIMLQSYGQWVLTGVTREKASRVVEVLLSVITARQLLVGKVLGIGAIALLHAAVLIVTAFVTSRIIGIDLTDGFSAGNLALAGVWFLLGYALYCGAYAAAGSLVSRVEDAQSAAFPIMLPLLFAYIVSFSVAEGANTLMWVLAFIPPTAVVAMPTLYSIGAAPVWAMLLSMALTVAAIVLVARLAARIYENSVLQSGKRVGWRQALTGESAADRDGAVDDEPLAA